MKYSLIFKQMRKTNEILSLYKSSVCVCICASNISGLICNVAFVWTAMTPLINYFINALQIPRALSTGATTARTRANHCRALAYDIL